jgi:phasin family protein
MSAGLFVRRHDDCKGTIDFKKNAPTMSFAALQQLALGHRRAPLHSFRYRVPVVFSLYGAFMSTPIPQRLADAQNARIKQLFAFSSNAFEGIEKLSALNLQAVKATLAENEALMARALSARPGELIALSTSLAKPTAEKIAAYNRHVYEIMSGIQIALSANAPSQYQPHERDAQGFVENSTKDASPGTNIIDAE